MPSAWNCTILLPRYTSSILKISNFFHAKEFLEAGYAVIFLHRKGVPVGEWTCDPNVDRIQGILTGIFQSDVHQVNDKGTKLLTCFGGFDSCWRYHTSVSKIWGIPQWMVKIMEKPINMDDFGGKTHYFRKHPSIVCFPSNVFTQLSASRAFASKLDAGKTPHHHGKLNLQQHRISLLFGPTLVKGYWMTQILEESNYISLYEAQAILRDFPYDNALFGLVIQWTLIVRSYSSFFCSLVSLSG